MAHVRPPPRSWLVLLALVLGLALSAHAFAQDRATTAEALFQAGRQAMDAKDYETACERFEESHRLEPTGGALLNLANCREKLGELATAWQRFQEAIQTLPAKDERVAVARARAKALEPRIPKLTLVMKGDVPEGLVVLRDGTELGKGSLNLALPVNPGPHDVVVRAPGRADWRSSIDVNESQQKELVLELGAVQETPPASAPVAAPSAQAPAREPARAPVDEPSGSGQRTLGYAVTAVGAAGIVASLVTGALVLSEKSTVEKECDASKRCTNAGLDAAERGSTLSTISTLAFGIGVVGLGVGAYLVFSGGDGSSAATGLGVGASASADGARLELGGRF